MTDGPQQPNTPQETPGSPEQAQPPQGSPGAGEQPRRPNPRQPTLPFRADTSSPGYGYPPAQPPQGYGYPPAQPSGYGFPPADPAAPQQPAWSPPAVNLARSGFPQQPHGPGAEPDWSALAERTEAEGRRRKVLFAAGGVLAAALVAAIVATAVVVTGHHKHPVAAPDTAPSSPQPTPSFSDVTPPPPPDPLAILSDPKKDTAPLTPDGLFPGTRLVMDGRTYAKGATDSTAVCADYAAAGLGTVLSDEGCRKMLRATYERGGVAVTVGVAVFDTKAEADTAKTDFTGYVVPLSGAGVPAFCHATACHTSANSVGRYAYFTISGFTNGSAVTSTDTTARQAGDDIASFAFNRIVQRGRDEGQSEGG
ncbi:hypothetical protein K7472_03075 [Streptomyces sp. PTM05]|uniref:Uncharacterized protein n=1 Tax=Streptantibioticus parmotrematis TaxID=2873249 RepID=A0ABS7QKX7_9ACTN|nr:hypothetical protein [Streptantibioticus parmotrematis]MBY8883823.1 hypothetical protein [Streptantibioticus parmotrematis]